MKSVKYTMNVEEWKRFGKNALVFTAPALVAFFGALSQGVEFNKAWPIALVIFWGLVADFVKKFSEGK